MTGLIPIEMGFGMHSTAFGGPGFRRQKKMVNLRNSGAFWRAFRRARSICCCIPSNLLMGLNNSKKDEKNTHNHTPFLFSGIKSWQANSDKF